MKYTDILIGFREVPDEISLCINISNCPYKCKNCHSPQLQSDIGKDLNAQELKNIINNNKQNDFTCICLMGGDADILSINDLGKAIHNLGYKSCWYSGREYIPEEIDYRNFDYIKYGPYIEEKGPLDNYNTNQRMIKIINYDDNVSESEDITYKFYRK